MQALQQQVIVITPQQRRVVVNMVMIAIAQQYATQLHPVVVYLCLNASMQALPHAVQLVRHVAVEEDTTLFAVVEQTPSVVLPTRYTQHVVLNLTCVVVLYKLTVHGVAQLAKHVEQLVAVVYHHNKKFIFYVY